MQRSTENQYTCGDKPTTSQLFWQAAAGWEDSGLQLQGERGCLAGWTGRTVAALVACKRRRKVGPTCTIDDCFDVLCYSLCSCANVRRRYVCTLLGIPCTKYGMWTKLCTPAPLTKELCTPAPHRSPEWPREAIKPLNSKNTRRHLLRFAAFLEASKFNYILLIFKRNGNGSMMKRPNGPSADEEFCVFLRLSLWRLWHRRR